MATGIRGNVEHPNPWERIAPFKVKAVIEKKL